MQKDKNNHAKADKAAKRIQRSFDNLDKKFDLGFITEKEFEQKRKKLVRKFARELLAKEEAMLLNLKRETKRIKLSITRHTQRSLILLTHPDGLKYIDELEKGIRGFEEILARVLSARKDCEKSIKNLKAMLKKAGS